MPLMLSRILGWLVTAGFVIVIGTYILLLGPFMLKDFKQGMKDLRELFK